MHKTGQPQPEPQTAYNSRIAGSAQQGSFTNMNHVPDHASVGCRIDLSGASTDSNGRAARPACRNQSGLSARFAYLSCLCGIPVPSAARKKQCAKCVYPAVSDLTRMLIIMPALPVSSQLYTNTR